MGADTSMEEPARAGGVNWRSVAWITGAALALYAGFRLLPTGTNLHHMDFQVSGANALEMCDPANPQFIPVVAAKSPVRMELRAESGAAPAPGRETRWALALATSGGKPIGPVDLLTVHTRKLHLLVVDPTLQDYQHIHPEPGARPGEWVFAHTPRRGGTYRVFADFTPAATGRGLYSFVDYTANDGNMVPAMSEWRAPALGEDVERGDHVLSLNLEKGAAVKAGAPGALVFSIRAKDGSAVPLEPVMGLRRGEKRVRPPASAPGRGRRAGVVGRKHALVSAEGPDAARLRFRRHDPARGTLSRVGPVQAARRGVVSALRARSDEVDGGGRPARESSRRVAREGLRDAFRAARGLHMPFQRVRFATPRQLVRARFSPPVARGRRLEGKRAEMSRFFLHEASRSL